MIESDIRILLADHQAMVRCGLQRILNDVPQLSIIGVTATAEETVQMAGVTTPDIVLIAMHISVAGCLEAIRRITATRPETRVVVVAEHVNDPFPPYLLEAGAAGYLTRYCTVEEIVEALRTVHSGERYICADVARQMALTMLPGQDGSVFDRLTRRELQIMVMFAEGRRVQDISDKLCLSPKTIYTYRYRLYSLFGVDNDVELAHVAIRHGIVGHPGGMSFAK